MGTAFIFAAGASRGTLGEMAPVAAEFGKALIAAATPAFPALEKVAHHLGKKLSDLGLEEIWTRMDYYAKFQAMLPNPPPWGIGGIKAELPASAQLKRALLWVYGRRCDERADGVSSKGTLFSLLKTVRAGDVLISFNYDTLVSVWPDVWASIRVSSTWSCGPTL